MLDVKQTDPYTMGIANVTCETLDRSVERRESETIESDRKKTEPNGRRDAPANNTKEGRSH